MDDGKQVNMAANAVPRDRASSRAEPLDSNAVCELAAEDVTDVVRGLDVVSDDPADPRRWSWLKKHAVLLTLLPGCLMTDGIITYGTSVFEPQAIEWGMSVQAVSQSISGAVFMQGPGGLLAVALSQRFGRLPTLFWSQILLLVVTLGAAGSGSYAGFTACRTLQGALAAPPQVIGLSVINDMFVFSQRARKVNLWVSFFLLGPYAMPFLSALLAQAVGWRANFWILAGFVAASVLLVVLFGDETYFDRSTDAPVRDNNLGLMRRLKLLMGWTGWREVRAHRPSIWQTQKEQWALISKPYVLLPCFGFIMPITMWTIGLVNTVSQFVLPPPEARPPGYGFSTLALALLFLAPMIGVGVAELLSRAQNDTIQARALRRAPGVWKAETRLWGVYAPWLVAIAGLIVYGLTLQHHASWVGLAFGWSMLNCGTLGVSTAISAYLLDVFPEKGEMLAAWILQGRVLGGFTVTYFQLPWVQRSGPAVTFGCQAAVIAAAIASIVATQIFGRGWRERYPPFGHKSPVVGVRKEGVVSGDGF